VSQLLVSSVPGRDLGGHAANDTFSGAQSHPGLNNIKLRLQQRDCVLQAGLRLGAVEAFSGFWPPKERLLFRLM